MKNKAQLVDDHDLSLTHVQNSHVYHIKLIESDTKAENDITLENE